MGAGTLLAGTVISNKIGYGGFMKTTVTLLLRGALAGIALLSVGCAGYSSQISETVSSMKTGSLDQALADLEGRSDKDMLFHLEKGELLRMKGAYQESRDTWLAADRQVQAWEEAVKTDPTKLLGDIGSFIVNDTTRRYDGRDYEKVFLNVRLALDHLATGDWGAARTEIKKMHERESIIAEFRAKEIEDAKEKAASKGVEASSYKELNGYPVETLNDPGVSSLKNAYESAIANYLAGFVYEALGEPSLAAAGYRKSIEMRPGEKMLEESLAGLDARVVKAPRTKGFVDTLFIVESESAPAISSVTLPIMLPIPSSRGISLVATPLSWPVIKPLDASGAPSSITVDDKSISVSLLTNVDHMARRALSDEMPGIIARSAVRAIAKGAAQKAVQDNSSRFGLFGALLSAASSVTAVVSEKADERSWRTLPAFYSAGRATLPVGVHKVTIHTPAGPQTREVQLSGSYAVVTVRYSGGSVYLAQPPYVAPTPVARATVAPIAPVASSDAGRRQ